jgi:hypothetical protein
LGVEQRAEQHLPAGDLLERAHDPAADPQHAG